jgi:hypothetical protein
MRRLTSRAVFVVAVLVGLVWAIEAELNRNEPAVPTYTVTVRP